MNESALKQQKALIKNHLSILIFLIPISLILGILTFSEIISLNIFSSHKINYLFYEILFLTIIVIFTFFFSLKKYLIQYLVGIIISIIFSISISFLLFTNTKYYQFFLYLITLSIYHYTEYFSVLIYHFKDLSFSSFLIDQSNEWIFASIFSLSETLIGTYFFSNIKQNKYTFILGLIATIIGQFFRISALFTGKKNFTHLVSYNKKKGHILVKSGIYSISRHPSYFGFYLWSIGIQLMCLNIICFIGFIIALYVFFKERIIDEEGMLIEFFGYEYLEYKKQVGILIPFINMDKEEENLHLKKYIEG